MQQLTRALTLHLIAVGGCGGDSNERPPASRVGSGAVASLPAPSPTAVLNRRPLLERLEGHGLPPTALSIIALSLTVIMMMPNLSGQHHSGNRDFNYRIPPSWSPERVQLLLPSVHDGHCLADYVD